MNLRRFHLHLWLSVLLASFFVVPTGAATLLHPGYSDFLIADIPNATDGFGGLTLDADGSILVTSNGARKIFRVTAGGTVQELAAADAAVEELLDVTRISDEKLLVTTRWRPQFHTLNASGGPLIPLPDLDNTRNPMAVEIAPASFGSFAGKAIFSTFAHFGVEAFDWNTHTVTPVANVDFLSDIEFSPDGRLFGVSFDANSVVEIHADGTFETLAHLPTLAPPFNLSQPDGLAIHPLTKHIFVAEPNSQRVFEVDLDGHVSLFAENMDFDVGFFVSGMGFSTDGSTLYYLAGNSTQSLRAISGFPAIPEPSSLGLAFVALMSAAATTKRRHAIRK